MDSFPKDIAFKLTWRKYQQRVLDELHEHLEDRHLHVIAPPGSGKTILGLEVMLRLNEPTLILAPTIAIRNQWVHRFCHLFVPSGETPEWLSRNIRKPSYLTISTYQALHAASSQESPEETDELEEEADESVIEEPGGTLGETLTGLKAAGIKTIIADEAHHLKNEWWQTLNRIKTELSPRIIGLTATPPYDVTLTEWEKYLSLNGPIDTEISVPELVVEGDLCPHHDYVYLTWPSPNEQEDLEKFRERAANLFDEISRDEILLRAIENHPIIVSPGGQMEWIYNHISYYGASLVFLHANGRTVDPLHLEIMGDKDGKIPDLDYSWMENLLRFYLDPDEQHFHAFKEHQNQIHARLSRAGLIERKQINFTDNAQIRNLLIASTSKLEAIREIASFESRAMGDTLRMVILTDYIRKEFLTAGTENNLELNRLGVMPIFEMLRRHAESTRKLGVLSGSLVIIPKSAQSSLVEKLSADQANGISFSPIAYDPDYLLVSAAESIRHELVHIITQVFQAGDIEILVGTKSLLGEGWDAPAINALILATVVGSFVLSNQMRGRAIRTEKNNPAKTGNIWHIVCVDPSAHRGGEDFELLTRRFRSFVGLTNEPDPEIENGLSRLRIPEPLKKAGDIETCNQESFRMAEDRSQLHRKWKTALAKGVSLVEEIKIPYRGNKPYQQTKSLYWNRTIRNLIATLSFGIFQYLDAIVHAFGRGVRGIRSLPELYAALAVAGVGGMLIFGARTYQAFRLYLKYRDIAKDMRHIARAVLESLEFAGALNTPMSRLRIESHVTLDGSVQCHLEGGSSYERSIFINALQEIASPVNNPRYVIIRKSKLFRLIRQQDYHAVPEILGRKKELAEFFCGRWEFHVGPCELVYTRTPAGRELILKSRLQSLASQFDQNPEYVNKWR